MIDPRTSPRLGRAATGIALVACATVALGLVGCGGEEEPAPVARTAPPPPPPPPPAPTATPIVDLMAQYSIDPRISWDESKAPESNEERVAVLQFFDAFTRGDDTKLAPMLSPPDKYELDALVESGAWDDVTADISQVQIEAATNPSGQPCALAIFFVGDTFQPQLWVYELDGDAAEFSAEPTPPRIMDLLSGTDFIAAWYAINEAELARAMEPDVEIEVPQQDYSEGDDSGSGDFSAPSFGPGMPSGPRGPGKRQPLREPISPPGPPGFSPGGN